MPSARTLTYNVVALLVLAGLSLGLRFVHLGPFNFAAALGIATLKAVLVAVFFMEIVREKATVRLAFAAGLSLFVLLLFFVVADVLTRKTPPLQNPPGTAQRYRG
jgi:cytochrome c oxidase subunit 4